MTLCTGFKCRPTYKINIDLAEVKLNLNWKLTVNTVPIIMEKYANYQFKI
jgi:hypothetical protein